MTELGTVGAGQGGEKGRPAGLWIPTSTLSPHCFGRGQQEGGQGQSRSPWATGPGD